MKLVAELRLENLERLVKEMKTLEAVAVAGGTSSVYLSQVRNRVPDVKTGKLREMGSAMARRLEAGCGKAIGWMDQDHGAEAAQPAVAHPSVHVGLQTLDPDEDDLLMSFRKFPQEIRSELVRDFLRLALDHQSPQSAAVFEKWRLRQTVPPETVAHISPAPTTPPAPRGSRLVKEAAPNPPAAGKSASRYVATDKPGSGAAAPKKPAPATHHKK